MRAGERFVASARGWAAIRCAALVMARFRAESHPGQAPAPGALCGGCGAGTAVAVRLTCGEGHHDDHRDDRRESPYAAHGSRPARCRTAAHHRCGRAPRRLPPPSAARGDRRAATGSPAGTAQPPPCVSPAPFERVERGAGDFTVVPWRPEL
ncbi:hypothetical protein GCM10010294_11200 [Streptomyces griseoloalbus]|nr:hypothetical protein GCM10010294_11200 [Streptomyces griseoloalbus]